MNTNNTVNNINNNLKKKKSGVFLKSTNKFDVKIIHNLIKHNLIHDVKKRGFSNNLQIEFFSYKNSNKFDKIIKNKFI